LLSTKTYCSIWSTSMTANTICSSQVALISWSKGGIFLRISLISPNNLRMKTRRCSISSKFKYTLWHGTTSMKSFIAVVKLPKSMSGWWRLTPKDNFMIQTVILRWFLPWLWCQSYNFWQLEGMMVSSFSGTPFPKQKSSNTRNTPDLFPAWPFIKASFCCLLQLTIIQFVFGTPTFNHWSIKSSTMWM